MTVQFYMTSSHNIRNYPYSYHHRTPYSNHLLIQRANEQGPPQLNPPLQKSGDVNHCSIHQKSIPIHQIKSKSNPLNEIPLPSSLSSHCTYSIIYKAIAPHNFTLPCRLTDQLIDFDIHNYCAHTHTLS